MLKRKKMLVRDKDHLRKMSVGFSAVVIVDDLDEQFLWRWEVEARLDSDKSGYAEG